MNNLVLDVMSEIKGKGYCDKNFSGTTNYEKPTFIKQNRIILTNKYHTPISHRSGLLGKIINFFLKKLYRLIQINLDPVFIQQEYLNLTVVEEINRLMSENKKLSQRIDELEKYKKN